MAVSRKFEILQPGHPSPQSGEVPGLLERLLQAARDLRNEELPDLIGELERVKAVAWARMTAPAAASAEHDELLAVPEAARRLGISPDYLYAHHSQYPFTRRQGRKLLFSASTGTSGKNSA